MEQLWKSYFHSFHPFATVSTFSGFTFPTCCFTPCLCLCRTPVKCEGERGQCPRRTSQFRPSHRAVAVDQRFHNHDKTDFLHYLNYPAIRIFLLGLTTLDLDHVWFQYIRERIILQSDV
jgi:hypothetical protein